jgi:hypothetical protein
MKTYTYKMTRVYETIIEIDAENELDASSKLKDIDVYQIELEQCCVVHETIELEDDYTLKDKLNGMFINQIGK